MSLKAPGWGWGPPQPALGECEERYSCECLLARPQRVRGAAGEFVHSGQKRL